MEKFGIFELLDALSALSRLQADAPQDTTDAKAGTVAQDTQPSPPQTPVPSPPPTTKPPADQAPQQTAQGERNVRALTDFLARHERISKIAEKNK